jgi:hypothetical protein
MSTRKRTSAPPELEPYREQADALAEALKAVKAIQEQNAAVTQQRENVLLQRQSLLDSFEDESAVAELSKLGSRVEMCDVKLASLAGKLAGAEAELKVALVAFSISYNAIFMMLYTFLVRDASSRIAAMLHPSVRAISGASIAEIAALATEVIDLQPLAIRVEAGASMFNSAIPPENVQRTAEQVLPKVEPLLVEAAKHVGSGFVPPAPFDLSKWRESLSPAVAAAA